MMLICAGMARPARMSNDEGGKQITDTRNDGIFSCRSSFNIRRGKHRETHIPKQAKANPAPDAIELHPVC
jgi:hypothetical protein